MTTHPHLRGRCAFVLGIALLLLPTVLWSQAAPAANHSAGHSTPVPTGRAVERAGPVALDGKLTEAAWQAAPPITEFQQTDPDEGKPGSERTEVRILYDADAVYVGARMFDALGAAGVRTRLVRRDQSMDSDWFHVIFDTYHDHLGRSWFQVNPSGVKQDMLSVGTSGLDSGWDPIWEVATSIDSLGWTAELRIPFSQLRFSRAEQQLWGMQLRRWIQRRNEQQQWSFWTKTETGGAGRFGHLEGIRIASMPRRAEVVPYVVGRSERIRPALENDPFNDGSEETVRGGADLKYLLTSNLTLDATINPDFGQVEVDPAVVNLTQFETFFPEKRPFFVEGSGLFSFGNFSCYFCNNVSSLESFYSRRIGRAPQGADLAYAAGRYVDVPDNSTILGAAKITGRTANGFTIGLLDAVTREERARVVTVAGDRLNRVVEPRSNYFVGRLKKDARGGNVVVGAIATSVIRDLSDSALATRLSRHAEELGADFQITWKQRTYSVMGSAAYSNVSGSERAILRAQLAPQRYFQRPDRVAGENGMFSDRLDSAATALRGLGAYARVAKDAGNFLWETAINTRTPGFEVNDLSIQSRADYWWHMANVAYQWTKPTSLYRNVFTTIGAQYRTNWDGQLTDVDYHAYVGGQLPNFWNVNSFVIVWPEVYDDQLLRGGPMVRRYANRFWAFNVGTDSRKPVTLNTGPSFTWNEEGGWSRNVNVSVGVRPASNVSLRFGPAYRASLTKSQYVTSVSDPTNAEFFGRRYVLAGLEQRTLSFDTRAAVTFSPTMTLELYAQPFLFGADYLDFREFVRRGAREKRVFGRDVGTVTETRNADGRVAGYTIDPDATGPAALFNVSNPDFNFRSLRGNAVYRWEYRPGSTLFLVWTQSRSGSEPVGDFDFARDRAALFRARPDNVFLVKVSWWMGM